MFTPPTPAHSASTNLTGISNYIVNSIVFIETLSLQYQREMDNIICRVIEFFFERLKNRIQAGQANLYDKLM